MSHGMCGREAERKMLLSHLSVPLLVEIMGKGGFSSHFSVHLQLGIRSGQFTVLLRGLKKQMAVMPTSSSPLVCRKSECTKSVLTECLCLDLYGLWVSQLPVL